jgi:hypothetical protein
MYLLCHFSLIYTFQRALFIWKGENFNMNLDLMNEKTEILEIKLTSLVTEQATREQHVCMDS